MPFLRDNLNNIATLSSYAACVLMVSLVINCFDHVKNGRAKYEHSGFWDRHYSLTRLIQQQGELMSAHFTVEAASSDPIALTTQICLRAAEALIHGAAIREARSQGLPQEIVSASENCRIAAAESIVNTLRLVRDVHNPEVRSLLFS